MLQRHSAYEEQCAKLIAQCQFLASTLSGFPFVNVSYSLLGFPKSKGSLFIKLSLDKRQDWQCGIFHNSRYLILAIHDDSLECVSKHHTLPTFRKSKVKDLAEVAPKIKRYIDKL